MSDGDYIRRAIGLAMGGRGRVEPNPMVGCVIVKGGRIIGEGIHERYGGPHAEPNALGSCSESPIGATAYVTLEPCCHTNKQTPPCVPKLIAAKIGRVVIGCLDPNPDVNGKGVGQLREAGIAVDGPVLETECRQLIAPFILRVGQGRPYVTLKWAQTADGKIAGPGGRRLRITNAAADRVVHQLRSRCDAIVVGINTVLKDDPLLTVRDVPVVRKPVRIVLDRQLRIPLDCRLVKTAREMPLVICHDRAAGGSAIESLEALGVKVRKMPLDNLQICIREIGGTHVVVEPGPTLAGTFFNENLADRVWIFRSGQKLGDATAPDAAPLPGQFVQTRQLNVDGDVLTEYLNSEGPGFFSGEASADFVLAKTGASAPGC